jgi:hypothetical protein
MKHKAKSRYRLYAFAWSISVIFAITAFSIIIFIQEHEPMPLTLKPEVEIPLPPNVTVRTECPVKGGERDLYYDPIIVYEPDRYDPMEELTNCPIRCISTGERSYAETADVHIYSISIFPEKDTNAKCKNIYMIMSMESEINYNVLQLARQNLTVFDWVSTYRLDSHVPLPYFDYASYDFFSPIPKKLNKNTTQIVSFISNCSAQKRLDYITNLMKYMPVENYGACLTNIDIPGASKRDVLPKKKFTIVMENSETWDYVTEKLYDALSLGSVPIVMGAPNIGELAPDLHSYIDVKDFASPKHLAEYLKYLNENDEEYYKYLAWKERGFSPHFEALMDMTLLHSRCRLCLRLAEIDHRQFLPFYKRKWLESKKLKYTPPSPNQPDWTKEYAKLERDKKLAPGVFAGSAFVELLNGRWKEGHTINTVIGPGINEFYIVVSKEEYLKGLDLLIAEKEYKSSCDKGSARIVKNMRELEYLFTEGHHYVWEASKDHPIVYLLPIEMCYDISTERAWIAVRYDQQQTTPK